jgi:hypothetical protein
MQWLSLCRRFIVLVFLILGFPGLSGFCPCWEEEEGVGDCVFSWVSTADSFWFLQYVIPEVSSFFSVCGSRDWHAVMRLVSCASVIDGLQIFSLSLLWWYLLLEKCVRRFRTRKSTFCEIVGSSTWCGGMCFDWRRIAFYVVWKQNIVSIFFM